MMPHIHAKRPLSTRVIALGTINPMEAEARSWTAMVTPEATAFIPRPASSSEKKSSRATKANA